MRTPLVRVECFTERTTQNNACGNHNESLLGGTSRAKTHRRRIDFNWDTKARRRFVGIVHDISIRLDSQSLRLFTYRTYNGATRV